MFDATVVAVGGGARMILSSIEAGAIFESPASGNYHGGENVRSKHS